MIHSHLVTRQHSWGS